MGLINCFLLGVGVHALDGFHHPSTALQAKYPFYHTTAQISTLITDLAAQNCTVPMKVRWESCGTGCEIQVVELGNESATEKYFLLFGEHARELISPEVGLGLIQRLCGGETKNSHNHVLRDVLRTTRFRIIPNGNPVSRVHVERGEYCLRANGNGVDLNRNWPVHWEKNVASESDQLNPGPFPLSEGETKVFQKEIGSFYPNIFASVHSGTLGMYMPWAFDESANESGIRNIRKMKAVVDELDKKYCQCPSGAAAREVGYNSPGSSLDWVHSYTKSDYSFAFEIFTGIGLEDLRDRYNQQQLRGKVFTESFLEIESEKAFANANCFLQFNPETQEQFNQVIDNWTDALIELALIASNK